ncbi:hypothetical protein UlMin_030961 [Ulmus minor]
MEIAEDIVIVGAGIAGLTTSLALHRLGVPSLVLESSDQLRVTGFALTVRSNGWKVLEALGIAHSLRQQHWKLPGVQEIRRVRRKELLESFVNELPSSTIRFSSKVVCIEESDGYFKLLHLSDGTAIRTKVLIGCDGVNSTVARWLGLKEPAFTGRYAIRGFAEYKTDHGFGPKALHLSGKGVKSGFFPCDHRTVNWYFTGASSFQDHEDQVEKEPAKLKQFVLSKLDEKAEKVKLAVENTELDSIDSCPLRYRNPWNLVWGNISKGNVCVVGDAFHPMTPDLGQGGCCAMEDGLVLARCLARALSEKPSTEDEQEKYKRIEMGLKKYAEERKWRPVILVTASLLIGYIQQREGVIINLLRDKILAPLMPRIFTKIGSFDCGKLFDS